MASTPARRLNIGVACHSTYGGSGIVASELGLALAERGHQLHFVSHSLPFRVPHGQENTSFHEVDVTSYPLFKYPPYTLALATKLLDIHRRQALDLVHVHYAIPHAISAWLFLQMLEAEDRPRVITTLHGTDITLVGLDPSFFEITRFSLDRSDAVTAVSDYLAEETRSQFQPRGPVDVIPNFIDSELFRPDLRDECLRSRFVPPGGLLLGHLSNFRPVKRVLDVIRAFDILHRSLSVHLLMIGEGVDLEPARNLVEELGLSQHVTFLGAVLDVARYLAQLDLFMLPSEYESFGLAALEAMSCGVPVVTSRAGGLPEVVEDGVAGLLCKVGDPECLAQTAFEILQDEERRSEMGRAARRSAVERFPRDRVVDQYEAYYRQVIGDGSSAEEPGGEGSR